MAELDSSLFLTRLTHDARLEIYSHLVLPPFDGCQASTGLLLACRQLNRELTYEGVRQLRILLDEVSKAKSRREYGWGRKEEVEAQEELDRHGYLVFAEPTIVTKTLAIRVKVPFMLPRSSYDWHHQHYPAWSGCTPRRRSDLEIERERQERIYGAQVERLLEPLQMLHNLHASSLEVELMADEATKTRIARESQLFEDLDKYHPPRDALRSTALGRLLNFHVQSLSENAGCAMMDTSGDWAFNTTTVKMAWDFGSDLTDVSAQDLQRYSCGNFFVFNSGSGQALCTPDRLQGTAYIGFDVVRAIGQEVKNMKERIRSARALEPGYILCDISKEESKLARQELKLRKLGILDVEPVAK